MRSNFWTTLLSARNSWGIWSWPLETRETLNRVPATGWNRTARWPIAGCRVAPEEDLSERPYGRGNCEHRPRRPVPTSALRRAGASFTAGACRRGYAEPAHLRGARPAGGTPRELPYGRGGSSRRSRGCLHGALRG